VDRDGTLIEERHYPVERENIVPVPGAGRALHDLGTAGYLRIVLSNQSAVARGLLDEEQLGALHAHLAVLLGAEGGRWEELYYCPHHPEGTAVAYAYACRCRKPAPGLLERALSEHDIDLERSVFIGDSARDLFADAAPGALRILVRTGHPLTGDEPAHHVADDLPAAVAWLLSDSGREAAAGS
jgi:D-glycero-D-manno-heptose 1,7-bisphosphate phosphatase